MAVPELLIETLHDVTVVDFRRRAMLDSAAIEALGRTLYALVDERALRKIVLDFSSVQFLSSQTLGVLLTLRKKAQAIDGQVVICGMQPPIREVFRIMKIEKLFRFFPTEKDALAHFQVCLG